MNIRPFREIKRRKTKEINVGNVKIGGNNPISVQSMTNTQTNIGRLYACASSTLIGNLLSPCCKNTIARGILNNQSALRSLVIFFLLLI